MAESISMQKRHPYLVKSIRSESKLDPLWKQNGKLYNTGIVGLHEEIMDFVNYVCPSPEEHWVREIVISKVKNVIYSLWSECRVDVFGSFSTGLYLPTSDIDIVIFGKWPQLPLGTLERALNESKFAANIKVLSKATVPILKFTDSDTGLRIDISFNMTNSILAVKFVQAYLRDYPSLRYLVFTLKQFLLLRDLNEVWTGGISSYALILMCIGFLRQNTRENETVNHRNLGTLLLEFYEFYGIHFNYKTTGIKFTDRSSFVSQELFVKSMDYDQCPPPLCIEDPLCPGNNVARRSYSSIMVLQAFKHAYVTLSAALRTDFEAAGTILSTILHIPPATLESRKRVRAYALLMYQLMPSFFVPRVIQQKSGVVSFHLQQASPKAFSTQSSECPNSTTKEPIIVSARGLGTRPPSFLRAPSGSDMLCLSPNLPSYGYSPNYFFYDPLCFPISNPPNCEPTVPESVFVVLSHSAFTPLSDPALFPTSSSTKTEGSSVGGEPCVVLNSNSTGQEILFESELQELYHIPNNMASSEDKRIHQGIEPIEGNSDSARSISMSHTCTNLVNKLAPLRLFSSEQNVSCCGENHELESSCPISFLPILPSFSSSTTSSTKSKEPKNGKQTLVDTQASPSSSLQTRRGKSSRRRRRPLRKNEIAVSAIGSSNVTVNATETHALPTKVSGCYFSSNEEVEENGCTGQSMHRMKRRCSQFHAFGNCQEDKLNGMVTTPETARGHAKTWPSFKPSTCMDSINPERDNAVNGKFNNLPVASLDSTPGSKGIANQQEPQSVKASVVPASLKRFAVSRPRLNRA